MSSFVNHIILWFILMISIVKGKPQVPCYFIFGDSLVDNGNNNNLLTLGKANYFPYGIDFPNGPNGRFTNGKTKVDFIAELVGFDGFIPPFASARGNQTLQGVNYASGLAGILDETDSQLGDRISMNRQLLNHQLTILGLGTILGNIIAATSLVNKCLYTVDIGSNDYLNNYLQPRFYQSSQIFTPDMFATNLVQQFGGQLMRLHGLGARKVAVSNLGLLGCLPEVISNFGRNVSGCADFVNNYAQLYNQKLKVLIDDLNTNLPGARFIILNQTSISTRGPPNGLTILDTPCCKVSTNTGLNIKGECIEGQIPCSNRNQYVFFDNYHPTQVSNMATATRSYTALLPFDTYPTDISRLDMARRSR